MRRFIVLVLIAAACGDSKKKSPLPPLLGKQSDALIAAFNASCDARFAAGSDAKATVHQETEMGVTTYKCYMESETASHAEYTIAFLRSDVIRIAIEARTEAERIAIFDRVFANFMPANVREPMRKSITDPEHFDFATSDGAVFVEPSHRWISWRRASKDELLGLGRPPVHYQKEE